jgi:aminopeptidase YwaD
MDMVGGGPETKAVFHVTRGPMSLPSFVHDVAWAFAEWVNEQSYKFAATGSAEYPMVAPEGGKEPLRAEYSPFSMGSDHEVYQDASFKIPAIYLNDWPDRYIHTNFDSAANIDPSKLKRAAFIGGASAYFLAGVQDGSLPAIYQLLQTGSCASPQKFARRLRRLPAHARAVKSKDSQPRRFGPWSSRSRASRQMRSSLAGPRFRGSARTLPEIRTACARGRNC